MENLTQKLEQYMDMWFEADRFSGTVLISQGENILLSKGYGYANHEHSIPNTPTTIYKIGSITKQFTAASILQLCERNMLSLDDLIIKFIPGYKYADKITVHNLMSYTSGIPSYTDFPEYSTRAKITVDTVIEWLNERRLNFNPGESIDKSNSDYILLANIVELVSGMEIEAYYEKYIFKPLGMKNSGVCRNEDIIKNIAYGYSCSGEGIVNAEFYDMTGAYGSGFMYSNAYDLLKWVRVLERGEVINSELYEKMIMPYGYLWYFGASIGYGCFVNGNPVGEILTDGNICGYTCSVQHYLKNDIIVIVLSNNDATPIGRIVKGIKGILLNEVHHVEIRPVTVGNIDYGKYKHLAGKYHFPPTGWWFNIRFEDGELNVDRLFIQEYKRKKFKLNLVSDSGEQCVFACENCDSKFIFSKATDGNADRVIYSWDTLDLPYERMEGYIEHFGEATL